MQMVQRFQANDGSEWHTAEEACERDDLLAAVDGALAPLGPVYRDNTCDYENGGGYVQHKAADVLRVKEALIELSRPRLREWMARQTSPLMEIHPSWFGRLLDDDGPLSRAWGRMLKIDTLGREWGQPYFAANPHKGEQFARKATAGRMW